MREIITNKFNGISLKKNFTSKDLSDAFYKIKYSSRLRLKYQKNGLIFLHKKFNLKKMFSLTKEIYLKK